MTAVVDNATNLIKEREAHAQELEWLLSEISRDMQTSVMVGLEESLARLLRPKTSMKLVMSSTKSEALKGVVTRFCESLNECDLTIRIGGHYKHHPLRLRLRPDASYRLGQLAEGADLIQEALVTGSRLRNTVPARQTATDLKDILQLLRAALKRLKEPKPTEVFPQSTMDRDAFESLPEDVVVDFYVRDSNIITDVRLLATADSDKGPLSGLAHAFSINKQQRPDERILYGGSVVQEKARTAVMSQDPDLMAVSAKLDAVESHLSSICHKLDLCLAAQPA